ncbi:MarR family transcriptional regulator [Saccharothrix deserti]|uniref:MarR family transcriptional regulator n=1 Tax=Saccharothrix deserti TaxID=2593674 RepID=UPI001EE3D486|nr:MarR family transcriptional regulator [Saccharothrix deserti]
MNRAKVSSGDIDALTDAMLAASWLLVAVSARSIAVVGDSITLAQFRLLVVLDSRGPLKSTSLAEHLSVNPYTATRMADRLSDADLVVRQAGSTSRREVVLGLSPEGKRVVRTATRRRAEIRKNRFADAGGDQGGVGRRARGVRRGGRRAGGAGRLDPLGTPA